MAKFYTFTCLHFFCIFFCATVFAQTSLPTERVITLRVQNQTPEQFLQSLSKQASCQFSYNPQIFAGVAPLTLALQGVSVREALHHAFGNAVKLKTKGNYIILQKTNLPIQSQQAESRALKVLISGYVIDSKTQQKIPRASVYEKSSLSATLTNEYGYFQLLIETEQPTIALSFAKVRYVPQTIDLPAQNTPFLNVYLEAMPQIEPIPSQDFQGASSSLPTRDSLRVFHLLIPNAQVAHSENLLEKFLRKAQFSLLPMVGTNHVLSGLVRNKVSFNVLVGYNAGVSQVEVGGLANINRGDVEKVQIAGVLNAVAGKVKGVQIAGLINGVRDSLKGVQVAGFVNVMNGNITGVQSGGLANFNLKHTKGVQLGGLLNVGLGGVEGVQLGGLVNVNTKHTRGVQVAGLVNVALGEMEGVQLAGILNVAGKTKRGWQIGVFNYADSAQYLKQIGLVNFVRRGGYKNIELATNEMLFTDLTIRSGTPYFYTLARIGIRYYPNRPFWHYGYGLGCRIAEWRTWESNTELIAYHLLRSLGRANNIRVFENFGARYQLFVTKHVGKHFSIALGGALDFTSLHKEGVDYQQARTLSPTVIFDVQDAQRDWRLSGGGTLGLRFRW